MNFYHFNPDWIIFNISVHIFFRLQGSLPFICHPLASLLLSGYFQDRFGRRTTMILVTIPTFIAWVSLYFAQSMYVLYMVSAVTGMCTGLTEAPLHSYIGEIGEPHLRGTLSSISTSAVLVGKYKISFFHHSILSFFISRKRFNPGGELEIGTFSGLFFHQKLNTK